MAQRPDQDQDQPDEPDLGAAVQLEAGDTLAGPLGSDALDAGYVPPDRPFGLEDAAVTAQGQRDGESHEERLTREVTEDAPTDPDRSGRLTAADDATADAMDGRDVGIDGGAAAAEEAAMHDVDLAVEPVDDETPLGDPAVARELAQDPAADAAIADAVRDARETDRDDRAAGIDALSDVDGTAAPASGRADAGPGTGL